MLWWKYGGCRLAGAVVRFRQADPDARAVVGGAYEFYASGF